MAAERNYAGNRKIRWIIAVLSVLLAVSLAALAVTLLKSRSARYTPAASVGENVITVNPASSESSSTGKTETGGFEETGSTLEVPDGLLFAADSPSSEKPEKQLLLFRRHPSENQAFRAENLFPGDSLEQTYRLRVSFSNQVTVRFSCRVYPGYEKLAEVLKLRLIQDGQTVYDGLLRDLPEIRNTLTGGKNAQAELVYECQVFLDSSVTNEYQNRALTADFCWQAEEPENLNPQTGDRGFWIPAAAAAVCAVVIVVLLIFRRRSKKEESQHEEP